MIADTIRQNVTVIAFRERKKMFDSVWVCCLLLLAFVCVARGDFKFEKLEKDPWEINFMKLYAYVHGD